MSMNLDQIRGVNPVYTRFSQGYVPQGQNVSEFIAPSVGTPTRAGKIVTFGRESFAIENTRRSPAAHIQRISPEYSFRDYNMTQDALAAEVPIEHVEETTAADMPGFELAAVQQVLDKLELSREKKVIDLVTDESLYEASTTGTVGTKWDDSASTVLADILDAKSAVRAQIGANPNSMVVGAKVFEALVQHPEISEHYTPTTANVLDEDMIGRYFRLSRGLRVAERVYYNPTTGLMEDLMEDEAVLFYAPPGNNPGTLSGAGNPFTRFTMSFAYQYVLNGYPRVSNFEFERDTQSWVAPVIYESTPVLAGLGATGKAGGGFLFKNLLS